MTHFESGSDSIWAGQWAQVLIRSRAAVHGVATEQLHFHFSLSCIGEGNGNPLQCSCLENPRDGGSWWAAIYGVAQSQTRLKWLSSSSSSRLSIRRTEQSIFVTVARLIYFFTLKGMIFEEYSIEREFPVTVRSYIFCYQCFKTRNLELFKMKFSLSESKEFSLPETKGILKLCCLQKDFIDTSCF